MSSACRNSTRRRGFGAADAIGAEGIVSKDLNSPYRSGTPSLVFSEWTWAAAKDRPDPAQWYGGTLRARSGWEHVGYAATSHHEGGRL